MRAGSLAADAPGMMLARGVNRMLAQHGLAALIEFPTTDGRRMDLCALGPNGEIWCVEVKSSRADFMSDAKWPDYLPWCDRFFFAVPESFPAEILPPQHGLIRADQWGAEVLRMAPHAPVAAARRKAVTLRFARMAAERLTRLTDR
ncbi:MAG: MmcB family DNA repair protein [Thermohalobaculum sp.]|nr:MmcB family DNA repair protein [Thermohalobaculum sp.]